MNFWRIVITGEHKPVRAKPEAFALAEIFRAVNDVSFSLVPGKTVALVGQSGSGKSTIAKLLLQLERPTSGEILIDRTAVGRRGRRLAAYRGTVQMVFQDPFASLNPYHSIGHHLARPVRLHHRGMSRSDVQERVLDLLRRVRLDPAEDYAERKPHELSGGQRQRVAIARALAPDPGILIADEPVSMLDVSIRLGVLNLLADLQEENELGVLYITHDLATARHFCGVWDILSKEFQRQDKPRLPHCLFPHKRREF